MASQLWGIGSIAVAARSTQLADVPIFLLETLISRAALAVAGYIARKGEDSSPDTAGAFTRLTGALMLKDAGTAAVVVEHSERRRKYGETDATVVAKAKAAQRILERVALGHRIWSDVNTQGKHRSLSAHRCVSGDALGSRRQESARPVRRIDQTIQRRHEAGAVARLLVSRSAAPA